MEEVLRLQNLETGSGEDGMIPSPSITSVPDSYLSFICDWNCGWGSVFHFAPEPAVAAAF